MKKTVKDHSVQIEAKDINAFSAFIKNRLGIIVHSHQLNDLKKLITQGCKKFHCSPAEFFYQLQSSSDQSSLLEDVIAKITVGETYFFRDKKQMELLCKSILPQLIMRKRQENHLVLRIWSAGCATGEEIYTLAIFLYELLPDISAWKLNLLGTDINTGSLHKALQASYSDWSLRSTSNKYKSTYFNKENKHHVLKEIIKNLAKFDYLNLNTDNFPSIYNGTNAQDIILCRNVLIYFDAKIIANLMQKFSQCLVPGGYLILGASDPIEIKSTNLIFHYDKGIIFSKPLFDEKEKLLAKEVREPLHLRKIAPVKAKLGDVNSWLKPQPKLARKVDLQKISQLLEQGDWLEALAQINIYQAEGKELASLLSLKGTVLANLGKLEDAKLVFEQSLNMDSTNKNIYFSYALTLVELNRFQDAEKALRQTLFIDHQFVAGHYQLGILLLRIKKYSAGLKCLHNALNIVKTKNAEELVPGPQALSYGRLAELLGREIDLYSKKKESYANELSD